MTRIRSIARKSIGGGPPGDCPPAVGEATVVDSQYVPAATELELDANQPVDSQYAPAVTDLELDANQPANAQYAPALTELELDAAQPVNSQYAPALTQLELDADQPPSARYAPAMTALELDANQPPNSQYAPAATQLELDASQPPNAQFKIGQYQVEVTDMEARADCWFTNVVGCVGGGNQNADPLQVEGVAATRKDCYIRFPVNSFPTGTTVTAAVLNLTSHAATNSSGIFIRGIADGNEDWAETAPTCNATQNPDANHHTSGAVGNDPVDTPYGFSIGAAVADGLALLAGDMGNRSHTYVLQGENILQPNIQFHDRTDATASRRPRLGFIFTKVV